MSEHDTIETPIIAKFHRGGVVPTVDPSPSPDYGEIVGFTGEDLEDLMQKAFTRGWEAAQRKATLIERPRRDQRRDQLFDIYLTAQAVADDLDRGIELQPTKGAVHATRQLEQARAKLTQAIEKLNAIR